MHNNPSELERRNRELSILNTIAEALNREVDLRQALDTALAHVAALFELRTAWIWLIDEDQTPHLAAARQLPRGLAYPAERMQGSCFCIERFISGALDGGTNVNVVACTRLKNLVDDTDGLRYHASIPLYAHGRRLGLLNVASPAWREFTQDDLRLLTIIGDLLGIAIERASLFARSAELGALEERNRLAREIHDTLAQGLTAIILKLETADALLEAQQNPARAHQILQQALELTRRNLDAARRSVYDLRAAPLDGRTLADALRDLVADAARPDLIQLAIDATATLIPTRLNGGLYRIAQEALSNALRHAQSTRIVLSLRVDGAQLRLRVADNGRGFDPAQIPVGHFGVIGLYERARLLGGQLEIRSAPGAGASVEVVVSL